ncbi:hypothetical protein L1049_007316 [Liquidambar formosana]|uniref:RanBP2-type domain-containing protein n=1 Tax=Liquidambar formosana TaxID=63359 RepID=A0AAP0RH81_LIQFO
MVQISHPWPEWVQLMERLLKKGYFEADPFQSGEMGAKDSNRIRTACLNFARDRFDLIRYFSRKHIKVVAGSGCPSTDRKVINSGKRLRAHVGIDEGNVCSSCNLRGNCERAYAKAHGDEGGRTVDVMRILLTYGLDTFIGSVENKLCQNKLVKESVRSLLKEMVELSIKELESDSSKATPSRQNSSMQEHSTAQEKGHINVPMKQGDWICPKCNFLNFARNIKCLRCDGLFQERLKKLGEDQDHLPLKKGDWLCDKCNFLNFAKNTRCLQCKEKPPKRQLNQGDWECDSCNYINFRRNMVCLKCDYRRPKASNISDTSEPHHEDRGLCQPHGMKFVSDEFDGQCSDTEEIQNRNKGVADMRRFVEDESYDHDDASSWSGNSRFVDFPIVGGKGDLSLSSQKRERWKTDMAERRRCSRRSIRATEDTGELRSASLTTRLEFTESTDDEEMADWFGHRKTMEMENFASVAPEEMQD